MFDHANIMLPSDLAKMIVTPYNVGLNEMLHSKLLMANKDMTTFVYEARILTNPHKFILPEIEKKIV